VALELAEDRRDGVARERDLAGGIEAVDRLDEPSDATWMRSSSGSSARW
jgi:hypothetical protein